MRKTILLTLALVAGVSCSTASAKGKKDKNAKTVAVKAPVTLQSDIDSLSYTGGQARTIGMMDFVNRQLGVDTAYNKVFVNALLEAFNSNSPEDKAKSAACYIATMVKTQMQPQYENQLNTFNKSLNAELFQRGFVDAVENDTTVMDIDASQKYNTDKLQALKKAAADAEKAAKEAKKAVGVEWLAQNKTKEGVQTTPSGLQYKIIRQGNGPVATTEADVEVRYEGKLIDGTVFDSSYTRNPNTTTFKPSQVIRGWTEALCMMPEGSEWELYIPENLAYGSREAGKIPAYATLIFKVEVVKVTPEPGKEEAPAAAKKPAKKIIKKK